MMFLIVNCFTQQMPQTPPRAAPHKPSKAQIQNRVRIIGGVWRSRIIEFPDLSGLRPTADRVRETLFNWLGQTLQEKRCLDLFAGSGALGFEAASRGAQSVTMVETAPLALAALRRNRERLGAAQCEIVGEDASKVLASVRQRFDVIFIDPPFSTELLPAMLPKLVDCLNPGGMVYAEWREALPDVIALLKHNPWEVRRSGRAGAAHFALLSRVEIPSSKHEVTS